MYADAFIFLTEQDKSTVGHNEQKTFSLNGQSSGNFCYDTMRCKLSFMWKERFFLLMSVFVVNTIRKHFFFFFLAIDEKIMLMSHAFLKKVGYIMLLV